MASCSEANGPCQKVAGISSTSHGNYRPENVKRKPFSMKSHSHCGCNCTLKFNKSDGIVRNYRLMKVRTELTLINSWEVYKERISTRQIQCIFDTEYLEQLRVSTFKPSSGCTKLNKALCTTVH